MFKYFFKSTKSIPNITQIQSYSYHTEFHPFINIIKPSFNNIQHEVSVIPILPKPKTKNN